MNGYDLLFVCIQFVTAYGEMATLLLNFLYGYYFLFVCVQCVTAYGEMATLMLRPWSLMFKEECCSEVFRERATVKDLRRSRFFVRRTACSLFVSWCRRIEGGTHRPDMTLRDLVLRYFFGVRLRGEGRGIHVSNTCTCIASCVMSSKPPDIFD